VILVDARGRPCAPRIGGRATLDDLFKRAAGRRPDAMALLDAPDRERVSDGEPRALTYRQADRVVSAIAGRLRRMGLHTDAIVAIQMASTVENVLTILGVLRAGLIAMPLPVWWRRADIIAALNRIGPMALIVSSRIAAGDHYQLAIRVAAEVFPIRYVCGYGRNTPDGLVCFDDLFTVDEIDPLPAWGEGRAAQPGPGAHLAAVTWGMSTDGLVPVARSHAELIAGGLAVTLESRLRQDANLLSTLTLSSFAEIASTMVPWLLVGGTLALHHPFDLDAYLAVHDAQRRLRPPAGIDRRAARGREPASHGHRFARYHRRVAGARTADPSVALARCRGPDDGHSRVRRSRTGRRTAWAKRQARYYSVRDGAGSPCCRQQQHHRRRDQADRQGYGGNARTHGAPGSLPLRRRTRSRSLPADISERLCRYRIPLSSQHRSHGRYRSAARHGHGRRLSVCFRTAGHER